MATEADWRGAKDATECLEHLCLAEKLSDIIFRFPDSDVRLRAHKFVLSMRSAVFEAMFYGPMAEKQQEIQIEDSDPETFQLFLRYVYTDVADFKGLTASKYLYLGRKYCVDGLVQTCSAFLESSITAENVFTIYETAVLFEMQDLQEKCMRFMADNAERIFQSEEFLAKPRHTLAKLLARDDLYAKEISVFEAAVRWAKYQCAKSGEDESPDNIRTCLGDVFYCIRFPVIPVKMLAETVAPTELLAVEEEVKIYRYIATVSNSDTKLTGSVGRFMAVKRKPRLAEVLFSQQIENHFCEYSYSFKMNISSVSRLKLLSISGAIFGKGITKFYDNDTLLTEGKWRIEGNKLILTEGVVLKKDVENTFKVVLEYDSRHGDNRGETFNILGTQIRIKYPSYGFESATFLKLE